MSIFQIYVCFTFSQSGTGTQLNQWVFFQAFQPFDTDGNGTAEVVTMLDAVTTYTGPNTMGELGKNIRMLQACSLLPGFVDVYAGDTNPISQHGELSLIHI